jgi:immunity protein 21 of polymorphic toxin system
MRWISTAGGPFVLLPASFLPNWRGVLSNPDGASSDYELACSVDGYVGVISKQGQQLLVLNDEPLETAFVRKTNRSYLVRWLYAPSEEAAEMLVQEMRDTDLKGPLEEVVLKLDAHSWVLMDAGAPGQRVNDNDTLRLELEPGTYSVRVHEFEPASDAKFLVLEFAKN